MAVSVTGVGLVWAQIETAPRAPLPCTPAGAASATPSPQASPTDTPDDDTPEPATTTFIPPDAGDARDPDPTTAATPLATPTSTPPQGVVENTTVDQPVPTPAPTPTPAPCPSRHRSWLGSGPVNFSGNGGLDLGEHQTSSSAGFSQDQSEVGLSMLLELSRRSQQTSLVIDQGIGGSQSQYTLSQVNLAYTTPKYEASFGVVNGPNDTQLSSGSYNRGLMVTIPHGASEIDLIAARTTGSSGQSFSVGGLRHSDALPHGLLFSQAVYFARGDQDGGNDALVDLALGRYKAGDTIRGELAVSSAHGILGVPDGTHAAYALHADLSGRLSSTSLAFTSIPDDFASLGQVQYAQRSFLAGWRRTLHAGGDVTAQLSTVSSNVGGQTSATQLETGDLDLPFLFHGTMNVNESLQLSSADGENSISRTGGVSLNELLGGTGLSQTASFTSYGSNGTAESVQAGSPTSGSQSQYQVTLSRALFHGYLTSQYSRNIYSASGAQTILNDGGFSYDHPFGRKADLGFTYDVQRVSNRSADALAPTPGLLGQSTATFSLTRRLSSVVAVRVLEGLTSQYGAGGGHARYLNVDLVGPLAIGNAARYTGRGNPNLPAIVTGHVYIVQASSSYGLVGSRGIPNVLVTLDGGITQRTDANGAYQFQFVKAGLHTMTLSDATLPVGSIADTSTQSFTVQGGQVATVDFAAGAFAGVGGFVEAQGGGANQAIPGVDIVVDGQFHGYTDPTGHYQIGHLQPGRHTVELVTDALPATVELAGSADQNVDVVEGKIATVNWMLEGLGSIQGSVLFADNAGFGNLVGARNIYVVAEPGDHAGITDEDGNFDLDNIPSGDYTLSIDADTIPDGQGIIQQPDGTVTVTANNAVQGLVFKLGPVAKAVIFGFNGSASAPATSANVSPSRVPDGAMVDLVVTTTQKHVVAASAHAPGFGSFALHKGHKAGQWVARVFVPETIAPGQQSLHVTLTGGKGGSADALLTIDPKIPLVVVRSQPSHPHPGDLVQVVMRILADVGEGDKVYFEDGQSVQLGSPSGRVYVINVRMWSRPGPYQGLLITRRGQRLQFTIDAAVP